MKNLSESLFKDNQLDEAIEYLMPSTIPSFMTGIFKNLYKQIASAIGNQQVIDIANQMKVSRMFNEIYSDYILNILNAAKEKAFLIEANKNDILFTYLIMKAEQSNEMDINDLEESAKLNNDSRYLWLFISQTKNKKLFKYLSDYLTDTTRYVATDKSIYVQLLPANNYEILDKICRAFASYL